MKFTKMHGLGNDFVLIDSIKTMVNLTTEDIKKIANRKYGVGCDQLLLVEKSINPMAQFNYRIFNSDGTEVEHCGNGARCVIEYLYNNNYNTNQNISLQIKDRIISGVKNSHGIVIGMGKPTFTPESIPFHHLLHKNNLDTIKVNNRTIKFGVVSIGNPHAIIELEDVMLLNNSDNLIHIAKSLQESDMFPNSVNVNFFVKIDNNTISLLTYERGCGFTLACGTGATATACFGIAQNILNENVTVKNPGGELYITWHKDQDATLTGPAVTVFTGEICL